MTPGRASNEATWAGATSTPPLRPVGAPRPPLWPALAPALAADVLVLDRATAPGVGAALAPSADDAALYQLLEAGPWRGIAIPDWEIWCGRLDLLQISTCLQLDGWLLVGSSRRASGCSRRHQRRAGLALIERWIPLPSHRNPLAAAPVHPGAPGWMLRTLGLPYAPPGRARVLRRAAVAVALPVAAAVPAVVLAELAPSRLQLMVKRP